MHWLNPVDWKEGEVKNTTRQYNTKRYNICTVALTWICTFSIWATKLLTVYFVNSHFVTKVTFKYTSLYSGSDNITYEALILFKTFQD